jgi:hypothetical protein
MATGMITGIGGGREPPQKVQAKLLIKDTRLEVNQNGSRAKNWI